MSVFVTAIVPTYCTLGRTNPNPLPCSIPSPSPFPFNLYDVASLPFIHEFMESGGVERLSELCFLTGDPLVEGVKAVLWI